MMTPSTNQPKDPAGFEVVDHTADWALRVWGSSLAELFVSAARGMTSLMSDDLGRRPAIIERRLELQAFDAESLLVDWLSELAFWAEDELLVIREFDLEISPELKLEAMLRGGRVNNLIKHIKAVTYHNLVIANSEDGLEATIVFDV